MKAERGVKQDVELTAEDLQELANQFKAEYKEKSVLNSRSDPKEQLMELSKPYSVHGTTQSKCIPS